MLGCGAAVSQQLLFPERLTLSAEEYALLEEHAVEFAALGFDIDCCGEGNIEVKGTPADLPSEGIDRLVFDLLQAFRMPLPAAEMRREQIAALLARSAARTTPRSLSARRPRRCSHSWPNGEISASRPRERRFLLKSRPKSCAAGWDNPDK